MTENKNGLFSIIFGILFMSAIMPVSFSTDKAEAEMIRMNSSEMAEVNAQGYTEFTFNNNVARLAFNVAADVYMEADSLKLGLSYRPDLSVEQRFLRVPVFPPVPIPVTKTTSDYQAIYSVAWPGDWGRINFFQGSQGTGTNRNFYDWDLSMENIRLGESAAQPFHIDDLVFKVYYDSNRRMQKVAIGTNNATGIFHARLNRYTGVVNPHLIDISSGTGDPGIMNWIAKNWFWPIAIKRDTFVGNNWTKFEFSGDHSGMWLILANQTDHTGWEMVCGYPEKMIDFDYHNPNATAN